MMPLKLSCSETRSLDLPIEVPFSSVVGYSRLFQLETWLRELVYLELKAHFGRRWWKKADEAIKRKKKNAIQAAKSQARDNQHRHMTTPETDPLWFTSFDSLVDIILDEDLFQLFHPYLTTKELLVARFSEISPVRNRVAHNRPLHNEDVERLNRFLSDFDEGFWKFCTSYNSRCYLDRSDPVRSMCSQYPVDVRFSVRPPSAANRRIGKKGKVYHFVFSTAGSGRSFDYECILKWTQEMHDQVIYIVMDAFQHLLFVSVPACESDSALKGILGEFSEACANCFMGSHHAGIDASTLGPGGSGYEELVRPFEDIASRWPHYVIPPGHAFAELDPSCECNFFGV